MTNSKELFNELVNNVRLDDSRDEIHSIIYLLLEVKLGLSKTDIMTAKEISPISKGQFNEVIQRINQHEPIQYILGKADFYGRQFVVNRSVLIPRPETELLAGAVIKENVPSPLILDIGTGSGCIAITLALEIASSKVYGVDISEDALMVAKKNAYNLQAKVNFSKLDIISDAILGQQYNIIVSNPPYIAQAEMKEMKSNVLEFEPHLALFVANTDPLLFYKVIAEKGKCCLKKGGKVFVEINERFGQNISDVFKKEGYSSIKILQDIDNKNRIVMATYQ